MIPPNVAKCAIPVVEIKGKDVYCSGRRHSTSIQVNSSNVFNACIYQSRRLFQWNWRKINRVKYDSPEF